LCPSKHLPFDIRLDRGEPAGHLPAGKGDHDFQTEEAELDENTDLTRAIHAMTQDINTLLKEVREVVVHRHESAGGQDDSTRT
jgi:hypothetical protein